jgi:hypothetical protein
MARRVGGVGWVGGCEVEDGAKGGEDGWVEVYLCDGGYYFVTCSIRLVSLLVGGVMGGGLACCSPAYNTRNTTDTEGQEGDGGDGRKHEHWWWWWW